VRKIVRSRQIVAGLAPGCALAGAAGIGRLRGLSGQSAH